MSVLNSTGRRWNSHTDVSLCIRLLAEKSGELGDQVNKLCNGLFKISDTREKVEAMTVELEVAKKQVAEFQTQCEEYLTVILQQKREADRQQKVLLVNVGVVQKILGDVSSVHQPGVKPSPSSDIWNKKNDHVVQMKTVVV